MLIKIYRHLNKKVNDMIKTKPCPLSLLIAGTLIASTPLLLQAEDIVYNDTPSQLKIDPTYTYSKHYSFFPEGSFSDNQATFIKGEISGAVYGGLTTGKETVSNNHVVFKGGSALAVTGGESTEGHANNNKVTFSDGHVRTVSGGSSNTGNADNNHVVFSAGTAGEFIDELGMLGAIEGGHSSTGGANNNSVTFSAGATGDIYGGQSDTGDANMTVSGNTVIFTGGIAQDIYGAESFKGQVRNNSVIFSGGNAETLFGGSSDIGDLTGNSIIFSGGAAKELNGAYSDEEGNVTNNSITISGGTAERLYGGHSQEGNATSNTISIENNPQFNASNTLIYGGFAHNSSGDAFSGNTLNFSARPISIKTIANFEHYNFTIDPTHANTTTALITAKTVELGAEPATPSKVKVVGIHAGKALNAQDEFILMQADTITGYGAGETSTGVAQQGIALLYDIKTTVDTQSKRVTATILSHNGSAAVTDTDSNPGNGNGAAVEDTPGNDSGNNAVAEDNTGNTNANSAARLNPQLKALSEGYLAGAMLVNRGADAIAYNAFNAINTQNNYSGVTPFVMLSGERNRYNSGSHIKSNDVLFTTGLSYQRDNITTGVFLEGGRGSYDSYNSFNNAAKVHGDGSSRYFGAGLLGRYDLENGGYTDASIRFGRIRTKFDTSDLTNSTTGENAKYNLNSNYLSTHIGAGYNLALNDKNVLDLSAKYLHSSVAGKKAKVADAPIRFKRVNSNRVRTDAILRHTYSQTVIFNTGIGYEHEFDGKANATALNSYRIDAPKVKGGTGIFSLGATIKANDYKNLTLDFNANGYVGKREGVGASIRAGYAF